LFFSSAEFYSKKVGVGCGDVVHLLTRKSGLQIVFAVLGAWFIGAVPAFSESSLSDEALIEQGKMLTYPKLT
jgi:hypothetical protein